jgi:5S rRNA maturation endonuclease (ribonuclease M5)
MPIKMYTTRWGNLSQIQLPRFMFVEGVLSLTEAELRVLISLFYLHKSRVGQRNEDETIASVKVTQKELMKRTGLRRAATISAATSGLQGAGFLQIAWDRTGSAKRGEVSSEYILTDPETREPLGVVTGRSNVLGELGIAYFLMPISLLTGASHLARLTGSEVRLYLAMLWLANRERSHRFECTNAQMCHTARMVLMTFEKALEGLQFHGLILVGEGETTKSRIIELCDPTSGEPVHVPDGDDRNDPARYVTIGITGVARRFSLNGGTEAEWEQIVRDSVPAGDPVTKLRNGELQIRCPFHEDKNPSCFVSLKKRCYDCKACTKPDGSGTLRKLIGKLTGDTTAGTIEHIARGRGAEVHYREPKSTAIAVYEYRNVGGQLLKQVRRFPNDKQGKRHISQRRPTDKGWVSDVEGIGPVLYNAHLLVTAGTVVIVEGEKDADTVTNLHLAGRGGATIGVTSGGAASWHPKLAKLLRGKVVIVMPDNDPAGEDYALAVRTSLDAQCIEYKTVSFAGTGAKDVTEYLQNEHTTEELVTLIDSQWVKMPDASGQAMPLDEEIIEA